MHPALSANENAPTWCGHTPRAWQAEALPVALDALDKGKRGIIRASTGSGKSILLAEIVAQVAPTLESHERIVVTAPTQKLVWQLGETLHARGLKVGRYFQFHKELAAPVIVACHASLFDSTVLCPQCFETGDAPELDGEALMHARTSFEEAAIGGDTSRCAEPFGHTRAAAKLAGLTEALRGEGLEVAMWMVDECHKSEAPQVQGFAQWTDPRRVLGFTATPWRASEKERLELFDELLFDYGPSQAIQDGVVIRPHILPYTGDGGELDEVCTGMIAELLERAPGPGIVSANSCQDADAYAEVLRGAGIRARSIHSRHTVGDRQADLDALERGELDCLVHVNLLAEGVDLPWLTWLCMRRASASRVRFCQEVGRVVRAYPGKGAAYVLDPHDLFGSLSLDYDAVLGGESEEMTLGAELELLAAEVALLFREESDTTQQNTARRRIRARGMEAARGWLRQVALALRLEGHAEIKVSSTHWRPLAATEKQVDRVGYFLRLKGVGDAAGRMTEAERVVMREAVLAARAGELNRGDVSDLLTVLRVLQDRKRLPELTGGVA